MDKNKIISAILSAVMLVPLATNVIAEQGERVLHVAVNGDDNADGTLQNPLASLNGAKEKIRALKKAGEEIPSRVIFHEGEYYFSETVNFEQVDSGTEENPISYEAAEGEKVEFTGAIKLDINDLKPISDETVKKKLRKEVADYVGEIDLKKYGITSINKFYTHGPHEASEELAWLYLNDKEQPLSQYPNGDGHYSQWEKIVNPGSGGLSSLDGGTIQVSDVEIERWGGAEDAYFSGYPGNDFRNERINVETFDPKRKTIKLRTGCDSGLGNKESKRWKVYNLLEEIDIPGEWYIDRKTCMLYYYAPYNVKNAELELSVFKKSFIEMKDTENIAFKNITFTKNTKRMIQMRQNVKNVDITGCSFINASGVAIATNGSTNGSIDGGYTTTDAARNVHITGCTFYMLGSSAIYTQGGVGDREKLESGGMIFKNNYIDNVCRLTRNKPAVHIEGGINVVVENNDIHNIPFHAINFFGNDHVVRYNNIYNACMEAQDAGIIYAGRSFTMRGMEVAYNYISDYRIKSKETKLDQLSAMYLDDWLGGVSFHHNIVKEGGIGVMLNRSADTKIYDNTFINVTKPLQPVQGTRAPTESFGYRKMIEDLRTVISLKGWLEKYPEMTELLKYPNSSARNELYDNLLDSQSREMAFYEAEQEYNRVEHNLTFEDESVFVDAENGDYRLKSDTELAKKLPNVLSDSNFDMSQIGIQEGEGIEIPQNSFKKLYPANGGYNVDSSNVGFAWEEAVGAQNYRLVIATDPELKNVVHDEVYNYPWANVTTLDSNRTSYYYQVYAQNELHHNEWSATGVAYRFTTGQYGAVDLIELKQTVNEADKIFAQIEEGNRAGEYKLGTTQALSEILPKAKEMLSWTSEKDGTQEQINEMNNSIEALISSSNINSGYYGIETMIKDKDNWLNAKGDNSDIIFNENSIVFDANRGDPNGITALYQAPQSMRASTNTLRKFRMKIDFNKDAWVGMGIRVVPEEEAAKTIWITSTFAYFLCIKEDAIELQAAGWGMYKSIPNTYIKNGEWHEIEFGVLNYAAGAPVIIFTVDGETVFEWGDWSVNSLRNFLEGGFEIMAIGNKNYGARVELQPSTDTTKEFPYTDKLATGGIVDTAAEKDLILKAEQDKAVLGNNVISLSGNTAQIINEKIYIPIRQSAEAFDMTVKWNNEGFAEIEQNGTKIGVYPKENAYSKNGIKTTANSPIIIENGCMKISAQDFAEAFGLQIRVFDEAVVLGSKIEESDETLKEKINNLFN